MTTETTISVFKVLNGKENRIENPVLAARIADLLTASPASQACLEAVQDTAFANAAKIGEGQYKVVVSREDGQGVYTLNKKDVSEFMKNILQIHKILESANEYVLFEGTKPRRGRTAIVADFSEA
jgi:hypothetical protein